MGPTQGGGGVPRVVRRHPRMHSSAGQARAWLIVACAGWLGTARGRAAGQLAWVGDGAPVPMVRALLLGSARAYRKHERLAGWWELGMG
jgi:hypothetical protein